jgi:hypothetical protein
MTTKIAATATTRMASPRGSSPPPPRPLLVEVLEEELVVECPDVWPVGGVVLPVPCWDVLEPADEFAEAKAGVRVNGCQKLYSSWQFVMVPFAPVSQVQYWS